MMVELLTAAMFENKVGQAFVLEEPGAAPTELTLAEVKPLKNYANLARAPFSLIFTTQGAAVLPQRMYELRHAALGTQAFFLVPVGKKDDVVSYQAIFN
ncbi:MAG TPA: hypothetical protein VGF53_04460 [Pseudolabrys sp.]|jgi:hypothetical protein